MRAWGREGGAWGWEVPASGQGALGGPSGEQDSEALALGLGISMGVKFAVRLDSDSKFANLAKSPLHRLMNGWYLALFV